MTTIPRELFILSRANAAPPGVVADDYIMAALSKAQLWNAINAHGGLDAQLKSQPLSQGQQ